MDNTNLTESNLSVDRTLSDEDLTRIFKRAVREGSLSPVDFMNCSPEDLNKLSSWVWEETSKLAPSDIAKEKALRSISSSIESKHSIFLEGAVDVLRRQGRDHASRATDSAEDAPQV